MARAITHIEKQAPNAAEEQAQAIQQLLEATAESRDALVVFLDIIKEMHAAGLLDIVSGILKNRHQIGVIAISQMNQPAMHHTVKNAMNALQFLARLEPDKLQHMLNALANGIDQFSPTNKHASIWEMTRTLRNHDVLLSISSMMNFLRGMGESLHQDQEWDVH